MARKKQIDEAPVVHVGLRMIPYYAIEFDHPGLSGHTAVGRTPEAVMANARRELRRKWPVGQYELEVEALNPDVFARAGLEVTV